MHKQGLHLGWTLTPSSDVAGRLGDMAPIPAQVPGCVHTDLLRANLIPDPYQNDNEHALQWIGQSDWTYQTVFTADNELFQHERIDLVCEGLDTVATITLNGSEIARTQNMHRTYR